MHTPPPARIEIWSALPTPFLRTGEIDEAGLRSNIQRCLGIGLHGVYCNGLMGEVWSLTTDERRHIVEIILDEAGARLGVSAVTSTADIDETIALTEHARDAGAAYAVLAPPPGAADRDALGYLNAVITAVDMPYVIFNPGTTDGQSCAISTGVFAELCADPRVHILKTTANADLNAALRQVAQGTHVQVSDPREENFFDNIIHHGQQLLYCDPEGYLFQTELWQPIARYVELIEQDQIDAAREVFASLDPLRRLYRKWILGPLEGGVMPNAALKRWCELIGMSGGHVRAPLTALSREDTAELDTELKEAIHALEPR